MVTSQKVVFWNVSKFFMIFSGAQCAGLSDEVQTQLLLRKIDKIDVKTTLTHEIAHCLYNYWRSSVSRCCMDGRKKIQQHSASSQIVQTFVFELSNLYPH